MKAIKMTAPATPIPALAPELSGAGAGVGAGVNLEGAVVGDAGFLDGGIEGFD
jgi:hypothetical protein